MPKLIVYAGHTPEVIVPAHRLTAVAGEPVEVSDDVADDLTAGGTSTVWRIATPAEIKAAAERAKAAAATDTQEG